MAARSVLRLKDMQQAIDRINTLLDGKSLQDMLAEPNTQAAFERFLEVLSEASKHIPDDWKADVADLIPGQEWRDIQGLGNTLRHAYHKIDAEILWNIYAYDLAKLEEAVHRLLQAHSN